MHVFYCLPVRPRGHQEGSFRRGISECCEVFGVTDVREARFEQVNVVQIINHSAVPIM